MRGWLQRLLHRAVDRQVPIPDVLWDCTLTNFPFLRQHSAEDFAWLRQLAAQFLHQKEFHGAAGLQITDAMAVAIAAQACLPVLHITSPYRGLDWYSDFTGVVVHADAVVARREVVDETGVVHLYEEALTGEAMQGGPVTLSWQDVAEAAHTAQEGYNVVVHEFAHKLDMRDGAADGCPPLPPGFLGMRSASQARAHWRATLNSAFEDFCDRLSIAERFGGTAPWLDPYAAQSIDEFFAVACEAYFVNPPAFARELGTLLPMFDAFFKPSPAPG